MLWAVVGGWVLEGVPLVVLGGGEGVMGVGGGGLTAVSHANILEGFARRKHSS